jgi:hypothetical protein
MSEWRHKLGDPNGYEAIGLTTQTKLKRTHRSKRETSCCRESRETGSESGVAARLARVEAHDEEDPEEAATRVRRWRGGKTLERRRQRSIPAGEAS